MYDATACLHSQSLCLGEFTERCRALTLLIGLHVEDFVCLGGLVNIPGIEAPSCSFGRRSFGSSGPTAWNDMPAHLRNLDLPLSDFRQLLKTALFQTVPV